ncbi:MAG: formate dehydrogenase accessory sulfurtransferase FdhD [Clostridium sp.]|nr:formate dehydrogenase accessory sulfurtransferase FdhD [Acetatifactor muris]MCM1527338.1 formate dehydrogenase accessory sulfurtransferase FdhD [Bacteroides sp.]MCM1563617.1 formate dehydrogenase accessory sulfurtransferase FdhD [Clostridium sp.]
MREDVKFPRATAEREAVLVRAEGGGSEKVKGEILKEHRMEIEINGLLWAKVVCTPTDLEELTVGRLITEQIIKDCSEIGQLSVGENGSRVEVYIPNAPLLGTAVPEESTCCTDNWILLQRPRTVCEPLPAAAWTREEVFRMVSDFARDSKLHRSTGGAHSCALAVEGQTVYSAEDIGRHNAMDKAIGYAVLHGSDRRKCMLFTTGRVPTDMVRKAVAAGIPVLISKAVPTGEAVQMAREYNLNLICRAWPDSFEIWAGA